MGLATTTTTTTRNHPFLVLTPDTPATLLSPPRPLTYLGRDPGLQIRYSRYACTMRELRSLFDALLILSVLVATGTMLAVLF